MTPRQSSISTRSSILPVQAFEFEVCPEEYAAEVAPFFATTTIDSDVRAQKNLAKVWQSDAMVFGEAISNPFTRARTQKEVQDAGHLVEVTRFLSGTEQGYLGETVIHRVPGPIYIMDQGSRMWSVTTKFHVQQMYIPKSFLDASVDVIARGKIVDVSQHYGMMLLDCMTQIYDYGKKEPETFPKDLFDRLIALLNVHLGVHPQREDVRTHLRNVLFERICNFIEGNLGDPDLSSGLILQNFGVSRASLYRMFEDYGGVRCYITHRRITRAIMDIEQAPFERGRMRKAALDWGFSSQPNFNRSIRKAFQTSPSGLFRNERHEETRFSESGRILSQLAERSAALPIAA